MAPPGLSANSRRTQSRRPEVRGSPPRHDVQQCAEHPRATCAPRQIAACSTWPTPRHTGRNPPSSISGASARTRRRTRGLHRGLYSGVQKVANAPRPPQQRTPGGRREADSPTRLFKTRPRRATRLFLTSNAHTAPDVGSRHCRDGSGELAVRRDRGRGTRPRGARGSGACAHARCITWAWLFIRRASRRGASRAWWRGAPRGARRARRRRRFVFPCLRGFALFSPCAVYLRVFARRSTPLELPSSSLRARSNARAPCVELP